MISNLPERIFLCGFMGAGKSVVGQALAEKLGRPFLDLDKKIKEKAGRSIPEIFEGSGESEFRALERKAVLEVVDEFEGIVALGGGSLQNQHMLDHIKLNGLLIFIETPISVILDRISEDENRPLLKGEDGIPKEAEDLAKEMQALYKQRMPLYEQAVITISNDGSQPVENIVEILVRKIKNHVEHH